MKRKLLSTGICVMLFSIGYAQTKVSLKKQMETYTNKIDSLVTSEKTKMNAEFSQLEKEMKAGEISESEMNLKKNEAALRYEEIINEGIDKQKQEYEEITGKTVKRALFLNDSSKNDKPFRTSRSALLDLSYEEPEYEDPENPENYLKTFGYVAGFSMLNFTDKKFIDFSEGRELKNTTSGNFSLRYENQLGKSSSPVFYRLGVGWRFETARPSNSKIFAQDQNNLYITEFAGNNFKRAWLRTDYLYIPIDAVFVLNPKFKDYNGKKYIDNTKKQLRLGIGLYGGVKINDRIHLQYKNDFGNNVYVREGVSKGLNSLLFGGKISLEYYGFNIYIMKDFTSVFNNDAQIRNKRAVQIGMDLWSLTF